MQFGERFSIYLKICLPLLILIVLNASPVSYAVLKDLREARMVQESEQSGLIARSTAVPDAYRRVLAREPWRAMLWNEVGQAELTMGRLPEAIDALRQAEKAGVLTAEGRFQLGDAYLTLGDQQRAIAVWQAQLRLDGPSPRVFERLVQVYRAQANYPAAIAVLREWRAYAPQDASVAFLLGIHLSVFQPDESLPLLLEASQKDASHTAAVQVIRRGLGQAGTSQDPAYQWVMIGRALGSIGQWDLAREAFRRAVEASPKYGEAWALLGEALYHNDGSGAAELEKAKALAPDSLVVRTLLALYWRREGKPDIALEYLQTIAREEPAEPKWQVDIGYTQVEANDFEAARKAFQKAVDLAPDTSLYWQYLARFSIEYDVDVRSLGLPAARQAILLTPDDVGALDTMGLTLLKLGDYASAERFLQRALAKDATYASANLHMGWLYLQQQDAGRAYPYLKQADSLAGENPVGTSARRLLRQYYGEGS